MNEEYKEKLKNPLWIQKRNEIVERDDHKCVICGEARKLHVHHLRYTNNHEPWEYPDSNFVTLCCHHHELAHDKDARDRSISLLISALNKRKANALEILEITAIAVTQTTRWQQTIERAVTTPNNT